jgi:hypothetical protein
LPASAGHTPHEHARIGVVIHHSYPVAKYRATSEGTRWIDCQDSNGPVGLADLLNQARNQGALSRSRGAGNSHDVGDAGERLKRLQGVEASGILILDQCRQARQNARVRAAEPRFQM